MTFERLIVRLRGFHPGAKLVVLLIAAWAPFLFPNRPIVSLVLMASMTLLFFMATGRVPAVTTGGPVIGHGNADVEP